MITYKGDRFVKGKRFILDSKEATFITKSRKGYIFESDNKQITVDEKVAKKLKEATNEKRK